MDVHGKGRARVRRIGTSPVSHVAPSNVPVARRVRFTAPEAMCR